jgi:dolichol-phosphate mannosyltransferase
MKKPGYISPFTRNPGLRTSEQSLASVSIVVPFYNEEDCVETVLEEIVGCQPNTEVVAIDDGSSDRTWELINKVDGVTPLRLNQNQGQSGALYAGMSFASGDILVMIDGDGQNDPTDIRRLVELVQSRECDVAVGRRAKRRDTWSRRASSKIANQIRRWFMHDGISDTGCSLKAFHRDHLDLLVPFNGLHRYLPAIFTQAGLEIAEIDVNHRKRKAGESKYTNFDRALRGIYDLIGVCWLLNRKVVLPSLSSSGKEKKS